MQRRRRRRRTMPDTREGSPVHSLRPSSRRAWSDMDAALTLATTGTLIATEYEALKENVRRTPPIATTFDVTLYDPASVTRARRLWSDRMVNEYTSTSVFTQLGAQLME